MTPCSAPILHRRTYQFEVIEDNMSWLRILHLAIVLLALFPAAQGFAAPSREIDRIVAVVNDEVITLYELRSRVAQAERQLRAQKVQLPPADILEKQMLERMVVDRVQLQMARDTSLRVDDLTLERAIAKIAESNRMAVGDFRTALEKDGISWSKFREEIRNEMTIVRLREREVDSRVQISDAEIDNFLAEGGKVGAEQYLVSHILLRAPDQAGPEQLQRLRAKAEEIVEQIKGGADFAKLAASYSDAPDALNGGTLGWRGPDRMPSLFVEVVDKMQPGRRVRRPAQPCRPPYRRADGSSRRVCTRPEAAADARAPHPDPHQRADQRCRSAPPPRRTQGAHRQRRRFRRDRAHQFR